jgi:hypothetical protein
MAAAIILLFFIPIVGDILAVAGIIFFSYNISTHGTSHWIFKSSTQRSLIKKYSKCSQLIYFYFILGIIKIINNYTTIIE